MRLSVVITVLFALHAASCAMTKPVDGPSDLRVVMLPITLPEAYEESRVFIEGTIAREFQQTGVSVIYGSQVDKIISRETKKSSCTAVKCAEALAVEFNTPYLVVPDVTSERNTVLVTLKIENPVSQELVAVGTNTCRNCDVEALASAVGALVGTVKADLFSAETDKKQAEGLQAKVRSNANSGQIELNEPQQRIYGKNLSRKKPRRSIVSMGGI